MDPIVTGNKELGLDQLDDNSDLDILNSDTTPEVKDKPKGDNKIDTGVEDDEADLEDLDELDKDDEPDEEVSEEDNKEEQEKDKEDIEGSRLRPSIKQMIAKVPEAEKVFKAFPQLRDAYYREAKFSAIYSTIEDAQDASEKAEALDTFDANIRAGSSKELLEAIGSEDKKTLKKFAASLLPTLRELDEDLFYESTIPVVNTVIKNLFKSGEKLGGKDGQNMMAAAKIIANHLHGSYDIPDNEKKVDPELEAERKKFEDDKAQEQNAKFERFETSVNERTRGYLEKAISKGLDESISEFTRNGIIGEVIKRVGKELSNDRQHMTAISRLWKASLTERLSDKSADRIITAFLSRAKQLIPEIRSKVKAEALGSKQKATNGAGKTTRREVNTGTGSGKNKTGIPNKKDINWKKQSDMDILNS
jgi:hypothetical protein